MGMQDAPAASRVRAERERESLVRVRREDEQQGSCSSAKRARGAFAKVTTHSARMWVGGV